MNLSRIRDLILCLLVFKVSFFILLILNNGPDAYSSQDSANYSSAIREFNLIKEQPHLPGYILYVYSLQVFSKVINFINPDNPHNSYYAILYLNSLFTAFSMVILYILFRKWLDWKNSLLLILAAFSIPQVLFYGSNLENYSVDLFFMSLFSVFISNERLIKYGLLVIAVATGFRQSFIIFVIPVYLFSIFIRLKEKKLSIKELLLPFTLSLIAVILWLIPLINNVGGIENYLKLYDSLDPTPDSGILSNIVSFFSFNLLFFVSFIVVFGIYGLKIFSIKPFSFRNFNFELFLYLIVALINFIFNHYNKGYFLIVMPIIMLFLARSIKQKEVRWVHVVVFAIINLSLYFLIPYYMPSTETTISKQLRTKSNLEIYKDRLFGNFLTSYNLSKSFSYNLRFLKEIIGELRVKDSVNIFYIHPSTQIHPKILKVSYFAENKQEIIFLNYTNDSIFYKNLLLNSVGGNYSKYAVIYKSDFENYIKLDVSSAKTQNNGLTGIIIEN